LCAAAPMLQNGSSRATPTDLCGHPERPPPPWRRSNFFHQPVAHPSSLGFRRRDLPTITRAQGGTIHAEPHLGKQYSALGLSFHPWRSSPQAPGSPTTQAATFQRVDYERLDRSCDHRRADSYGSPQHGPAGPLAFPASSDPGRTKAGNEAGCHIQVLSHSGAVT
jgi:hypothetical protein